MKKFLTLLIPIVILLSLSACDRSFQHIEIDEVKSITVWTLEDSGAHKSHELTQDEIENFLELYNASTYVGKATGEGCTPQYGAAITLKNDDQLFVNEFCGNKADIEAGKSYINNKELLEFIKNCV